MVAFVSYVKKRGSLQTLGLALATTETLETVVQIDRVKEEDLETVDACIFLPPGTLMSDTDNGNWDVMLELEQQVGPDTTYRADAGTRGKLLIVIPTAVLQTMFERVDVPKVIYLTEPK